MKLSRKQHGSLYRSRVLIVEAASARLCDLKERHFLSVNLGSRELMGTSLWGSPGRCGASIDFVVHE